MSSQDSQRNETDPDPEWKIWIRENKVLASLTIAVTITGIVFSVLECKSRSFRANDVKKVGDRVASFRGRMPG